MGRGSDHGQQAGAVEVDRFGRAGQFALGEVVDAPAEPAGVQIGADRLAGPIVHADDQPAAPTVGQARRRDG
jgi:hypothetical protein